MILHTDPAAVGVYEGFFGLVMQSQEAIAAGATYEPATDAAPWMYIQNFHMMTATQAPVGTMNVPVDVRARRRMTPGSQFYWVFETGSNANPGLTSISFVNRMLIAI